MKPIRTSFFNFYKNRSIFIDFSDFYENWPVFMKTIRFSTDFYGTHLSHRTWMLLYFQIQETGPSREREGDFSEFIFSDLILEEGANGAGG
jgi:hypothetical protein